MGQCDRNCAACSGCGRELVLTQAEMELLQDLGQIPFQPVARTAEDPTPVCPGEGPQRSLVLQCLEKKGLIALDYDKPIRGMTREDYGGYPLMGSIALTERGLRVLELLEYQGFGMETETT